jgi:peptidoglycan/LPS O-acetylase OafA/YrhL
MKPEFMGSIVVFLLGSFISVALSFKYLVIGFFLFAIWGLGIYSFLFPFITGIFLSAIFVKYKLKFPLPISLLIFIIGLYFLGFTSPKINYAWVTLITYPSLLATNIQIILNSLGAGFVISALMGNSKLYNLLDGKFCKSLGQISFPLYLVHALVICSFGSWVYIQLQQDGLPENINLLILFALCFIASLIAAYPLVSFDRIWLEQLNRRFTAN